MHVGGRTGCLRASSAPSSFRPLRLASTCKPLMPCPLRWRIRPLTCLRVLRPQESEGRACVNRLRVVRRARNSREKGSDAGRLRCDCPSGARPLQERPGRRQVHSRSASIGDFGRDRRDVLAINKPFALKQTKTLGQHLGRNSIETPLQNAESERPVPPQGPQDIHRPGPHQDAKHRFDGTRWLMGVTGHGWLLWGTYFSIVS